jgi:hypothetical protein
MPGLHEDSVIAGSVARPDSGSGRGDAPRSRLAIVGWAAGVAALLIVSIVLAASAQTRSTDKARDCQQAEGAGCVTVFDLVGPPGHLPSAAQLEAESGTTVVASWTLGSNDAAIIVPAATSQHLYTMSAACLGGGTMTVIARSIADPVDQTSMKVDCNGHMGMGAALQVISYATDSGQSLDAQGPYRFAVTTTGTVSAAEFFVV